MERQIVVQRNPIDVAAYPAAGEQRGQRRGEADARRVRRDVQRLDAQTVTAEDDAAGVTLMDGEGEHPGEVVDAPGAPPMVCLTDHLSVRCREETVARGDQLVT